MKMRIFACAFLFLKIVGAIYGQTSCHLRELDLCLATLAISAQNPNGIPQSGRDLDKFCGSLREGESCLSNFMKRCATPIQRELIDFLTAGGKKTQKDMCTANTQLRKEYIKLSPCLNQAQKELKTCVKDLQMGLERALQGQNERRIPVVCCAFRRFQNCGLKFVEAKCGPDGVHFLQRTIRSLASRLPDIVCQDHDPDGRECKNVLPAPGSHPQRGQRGSGSVITRLFSALTGF